MPKSPNKPLSLTPDNRAVVNANFADMTRAADHNRALIEAEELRAHDAVLAVAQEFGRELPNWHEESYIQRAGIYMSNSAEAALEFGIALIVIKAATPHGRFLEILTDRIKVDRKTAARMMQAARKFGTGAGKKLLANGATTRHLTKSQMFELITLDDDDTETLAETGELHGESLDDIAKMSVSQLRAFARDVKADNAAKDSVMSDMSKKMNSLTTAKKRGKSQDPDGDRIKQLERELTDASSESAKLIRVDHKDVLAQLEAHEWSSGYTVPEPEIQERIDLIARQSLERVVTALRERAIEIGLAPADIGLADEDVMPDDFQ